MKAEFVYYAVFSIVLMSLLIRIVHRLLYRWRAARVSDEDGGVAMYCCQGFRNLIGEAGQRGLSAIVRANPFGFSLQSYAVSQEDLSRISEACTPLPIEGSMTLAASIRLNYCPSCGTKLRRLATVSNFKRFQALAEKHKKFAIPLLRMLAAIAWGSATPVRFLGTNFINNDADRREAHQWIDG